MNKSMTLGKRVVSAFVAGATILWAVGMAAFAVPSVATAATGGDIIKGTSLSTVYYYGYDGSRYTFPNEKTYLTWFDSFSGVETLSDSALADITLAGNAVYRPGSHWIKIQSDPKTYAVATDGMVHWIETEAVATDYAGSDWNTIIHDVPDTFFVDYTTGTSLMSATAFDGMMYMDGSDYYLAWDGEKRMVSAAGRSANDMMTNFFLDGDGIDDSSLSAGAEITGTLCDLQDAAQTGGCTTAVTGGDITVGLASSTPAGATVPKDANAVDVLRFNVTAGSEAAELNTLTLTMDGIGATTNIDNVYLYEGSTRLTDARNVNASTRTTTFGALNYEVPAGTTKTLTVRIEVASGASAGDEISFEIDSAGDIVLDGSGSVGGSFPVGGNTFTIANASAGSVTIIDNGTIDNPSLGAQDATIGQFKITASSEDANLTEITLKVDNAADHDDFQLYDGDVWLGAGEYIGDKLVAFDLSDDPFYIQEGNSNIFSMTADIGGEAAETISVYLDNAADLVCIGGDYGFGMGVTYSGYDGTTGDVNSSTIQGGDVTMTLVGPTAGEILVNSQDQVLLEFTLTSAQNVTVKDLDVIVYGDDDADDDATDAVEGGTDADATGLIGTSEGHLTDIKIINADTGSVIMGPLELDSIADGGDDADQTIDFTDDFSVTAGETLRLQVTADVDDSMTSGTEFAAAIDIATSGGVVITDSNGDTLTNSTDLVPTSNITGYNQEALSASLDLSLGSTPGDVTTVHGADNVFVNRFNISAGDAGPVSMSSIQLTIYSHTSATGTFTIGDKTPPDVNSYIESCSIYDIDDNLLDGPTSPTSNGQTITFSDVNWTLAASESNVIDVYCNFANPSASTTYYFTVDIDDVSEDIVAEDENGTDVDPPSGDDDLNGGTTVAAASNVITVEDVGTLAVAKDSSTPSADILVTGSSDNHVATFRYTATNEAFYIDTLTFGEEAADDMAGGTSNLNTYANNIDLVTIEYTDDAEVTQTATARMSGNEAKFTGLDMYVDVNDPSKVKVYVDVPVTDRNAGGAATSNEYILMGWMIDATGNDNFSAVGEDSGYTYKDTDSDGIGTDWTEVTNTSRFVVKETRPTLSLSSSSPSGSGYTPGDMEVLRFNVAAHSNEDVIIDQMMFKISSTDNASVATGWNECDTLTTSDFDLYDLSDQGTASALDVDADWAFHIADGSVSTAATDIAYVSLGKGGDLTTPITVPAGETHTFALYFDSTGASASADDALQFSIPADPILASASFLAGTDEMDETSLAVTATNFTADASHPFTIGDILCIDQDSSGDGDGCDATDEKVLVTYVDTNELYVVRGYLGSTPTATDIAANTDLDYLPSTLYWQDDGSDGAAGATTMSQMWGSYLVDSLPVTGGTIGF